MNYSIENAQKFNWSSVSGDLNLERISHLETYIIGNKILDAGCGGGAYVEFLSNKGLNVTGIDKFEEFLQIAIEQGRKGIYKQGDIINLPFSDKTFDCTYCFDVLEHVDDRLAIQELARVTKKRIIFTVPQEDAFMYKFGLLPYPYQDPTHLRYYTEPSLRELVSIINPSDIKIVLEGMVQLNHLFKETLKKQEVKLPDWILRCSYRWKSTNSLIDRAILKVIHLCVAQLIDFDNLNQSINDYLTQPMLYKEFNLGLAVIVDL